MFLRANVCCVVIRVTIFLKLSSLPCQRTHCFIHNLAMIFYSNKTHQWPLHTVWTKQGSRNLELQWSKTKGEATCALLALDKRHEAHTSAHSVATGEIPSFIHSTEQMMTSLRRISSKAFKMSPCSKSLLKSRH